MSNRIALISTKEDPPHIEIKNEIDELFINQTIEYIEYIEQIIIFKMKFQAFHKQFEKFNQLIKKYENKEINIAQLRKSIESSISNVMFQGYKYIDNMKSYFTRELKKEDETFYKNTLAKLYDNNFSYRILYNMRNYDQHCDNPYHEIIVNRDSCKLLLYKCKFINEHTGMQSSFKKELQRLNIDSFDIFILLYEYFGNLDDFNNELYKHYFSINFDKNIKALKYIATNFKPLDNGCHYILLENYSFNKQEGRFTWDFRDLNYENCLNILNNHPSNVK